MKILFKISILIIIFFAVSPAQEKIDSLKSPAFTPLERLQLKFDEFDFYRELHSLKENLPANNDPNTIKLWTSAAIFSTLEEDKLLDNPADITSPLYRKYLEDSKFDPFKYVLGMAQLGAVGYLAYKHIKKYGFLK